MASLRNQICNFRPEVNLAKVKEMSRLWSFLHECAHLCGASPHGLHPIRACKCLR